MSKSRPEGVCGLGREEFSDRRLASEAVFSGSFLI